VDSGLRASAFAGLGAFALSIIIAIFSRVPFGVLVLRALVSGVGFFALLYGAQFVLKRFVPELFEDSVATGEHPVAGSLVDIVIPGDEDERRVAAPAGVDDALGSSHVHAIPPADILGVNELAREVADLRSDQLIASDPGVSLGNDGDGLAPRPSVALDELDTLPDLDGLSDAFVETPAAGPVDASGNVARQMGVSDSMPTAGGPSSPDAGQNPALLAKAVQTLLRRDQKGQ
jgi:hypothetical protein